MNTVPPARAIHSRFTCPSGSEIISHVHMPDLPYWPRPLRSSKAEAATFPARLICKACIWPRCRTPLMMLSSGSLCRPRVSIAGWSLEMSKGLARSVSPAGCTAVFCASSAALGNAATPGGSRGIGTAECVSVQIADIALTSAWSIMRQVIYYVEAFSFECVLIWSCWKLALNHQSAWGQNGFLTLAGICESFG